MSKVISGVTTSPVAETAEPEAVTPTAPERVYTIVCVFSGTKDLTLTFSEETRRDAAVKTIQNTRSVPVAARVRANEGEFLVCNPAYVRIIG